MPGRRPAQRNASRWKRPFLLAATFAVMFLGGFAYASWTLVCRGSACPDPRQLDAFQPHQTSKLYADDGRFVAELGLERRTLVPLSEIPKTVQEAFVITEDKRFYQHHGIDWIRVAGAGLHNIRSIVSIVLDLASSHYSRWRGQVILTLRRYALTDHVLDDIVAPPSPAWSLMDTMVLS